MGDSRGSEASSGGAVRQGAEMALATFEQLIATLDVGILLLDARGRVLERNPCAERILGLSPGHHGEELSLGALKHATDGAGRPLDPDLFPWSIALRTGRPCTSVVVGLQSTTPGSFWVSIDAHPLRLPDGDHPHAVAVSLINVTGAHIAQHAERRAADRFRSLIEHSADLITVMDEGGRATYVSPSVETMLGYQRSDFEGLNRLDLVHPEDAGELVASARRAAQQPGRSVSCEFRVRHADGSWRTVEAVSTNRRHDPAVRGTVINTRDITERREAEDELMAAGSKLAHLVRNFPAGVLVEDEQRRIALVNGEMCRILGIEAPPDDLIGIECRRCFEMADVPDQLREIMNQRADELIAAGETVRGEEVEFGGRIYERDFIPIDTGEANRGNLWVHRDATERRAAERSALRALDDAIHASRLKSEFVATLSHELRTPLNAVIGTVELLLDTDLDADQEKLATVARESAANLLMMIDDVFDISKIEADRLQPKLRDFDLGDLLRTITAMLAPEARRKAISLDCYVDPRLPGLVRGEREWLRQVLTNLAGNAVKFTDHGSVRVRAEVESSATEELDIRFAVTDTGIGIPAGAGGQLFEPFVQLTTDGERGRGGTGLGLAVAQRLVQLMDGQIDFDSTPGGGSSFWFTLRLALASSNGEPDEGRPRAERVRHDREPADLSATVLVAEDDVVAREVLVRQLAKLGLSADVAGTGGEAIDAAARKEFDAVLMDCRLPGVSGPDAAREIRSAHPHVPIVAMTAGTLASDRRECVAAGMNGFLTKPVTIDALRAAIDPWLARRQSGNGRSGDNVLARLEYETGDRRSAERIARLFVENLPATQRELRAALAAGSPERLAAAAHKLAPTAETLAATALGEIARTLEQLGRSGELSGGTALLARLDSEAEAIRGAIEAELPPEPADQPRSSR